MRIIRKLMVVGLAAGSLVGIMSTTSGAVSKEVRYDRGVKVWLREPEPKGWDALSVNSVSCIGHTLNAKSGTKATCYAYAKSSELVGTLYITNLDRGGVNGTWVPYA